MPDIGRNDPCHCGSGKKYKKCCEAKDQAKEHTVLEKQWKAAEKEFEKNKEKEAEQAKASPDKAVPGHHPEPSKPVVQKHQTFAAPKFNMPRKAGGGG